MFCLSSRSPALGVTDMHACIHLIILTSLPSGCTGPSPLRSLIQFSMPTVCNGHPQVQGGRRRRRRRRRRRTSQSGGGRGRACPCSTSAWTTLDALLARSPTRTCSTRRGMNTRSSCGCPLHLLAELDCALLLEDLQGRRRASWGCRHVRSACADPARGGGRR